MLRRFYNIGTTLLGVWLILTGIIPLLNVHIENFGMVMALLAIAAGILILMRR